MSKYIIRGGKSLAGDVVINGAKNAALGIVAAAIMSDEMVTIENLPDVWDINVLLDAIRDMGAIVDRVDRHTVKIVGSMCFWDVSARLRSLFPEDATSEAVPWNSTSKVSDS